MALLNRIRTRAELVAHSRVRTLLDGRHASTSHARSLDFSDLRAYVPGDEVADIDWKASARHGDLLVKRHVAERRAVVVLVVDTGRELAAAAHWDPTTTDLKRDVAVTAAGLLGWIALRAGDHVGLVHNGPDGPRASRPSTREVDLERMLVEVVGSSAPDAAGRRTLDLLDHASVALRRRTLMVLVLDDLEWGPEVEHRVVRLAAQHEVVVLTVADVDLTEPLRHGVATVDVGTRRAVPGFAADHPGLVAELAAADAARRERRDAALRRLGLAHVDLARLDEAVPALLTLMERRRRVR
ncbi:DUF58 domain-containing protein [Nocardioides marmotae]|uniref:DUF58 domain-containing protein n=1 Tax=Nocardioides marmotae TaxID=2663857 RepID=A0A6I3IV88_9ACTN|nr:DUF58 domain-containing protein [Nocardioides marmotae]MCR6030709.1 DUF58 domain-containing protein [Gordonia jinghuaiqii]MBC9734023.1 DUF58 domain-containing protein [Nocardioides marmotae]MTB85126.1 DUF58 domain-containing protein [Nocardioides marmotae]MTB94343.1 DUF58 domain-containing protein [Nocardioides marmotae]QKE01629.1 DUF58 domain-containing protein [Nocardioides marmotae]